MSLRFRRWLFAAFVLAFLIMATLIVPYAFGYKLDGSGWKLQKTGMFVIETKPKGAQIYLNDKLQTSNLLIWKSEQSKAIITPTKLSHVSPGNYRVRLDLDGYWPWEKELSVRAGESTYLEDVRFFKRNLPELLFKTESNDKINNLVSADKNWLAYNVGKELKLYNLETETTENLATGTFDNLDWSADSTWLIADRLAINSVDRTQVNLASLNTQKIWPGELANQVCYQNKNGLASFDLKTKESSLILNNKNQNISDCLIKESYSYIIRQGAKHSELVITKNGSGKELGIIALPRLAQYQLINSDSKQINIWDSNSHKLILISINLPWTNNYTVKTITNPVNQSYWIDDNRLLYSSDFEIWLYDLSANQHNLLTRVSRPINNIFWHPSQNYIVFATDQDISSLELDNRERHNITKLLTMQIDSQVMIDKDAKVLSFFGQLGQQSGYWQLEL